MTVIRTIRTAVAGGALLSAALAPLAAASAGEPGIAEAFAVRRACTAELKAYCQNVPVGGGRVLACLRNEGPKLSPACRAAVEKLPSPAAPAH